MKDTLDWIPLVEQPSGLVAYWPGSAGSVALTAWTAEFLAEAREGGYSVDAELLSRLTRALEQALRSDYSGFADGESWAERTWALRALARLGKFDAAYGNELARRAQFLDLENVANVVTAFDRAGLAHGPGRRAARRRALERLHRAALSGQGDLRRAEGPPRVRQRPAAHLGGAHDGRDDAGARRARGRRERRPKKFSLLSGALIARGGGDGWGSTNANASAILALSEMLGKGRMETSASSLTVAAAGASTALALGAGSPTAFWQSTDGGPASLTLVSTVPAPEAQGSAVSARAPS